MVLKLMHQAQSSWFMSNSIHIPKVRTTVPKDLRLRTAFATRGLGTWNTSFWELLACLSWFAVWDVESFTHFSSFSTVRSSAFPSFAGCFVDSYPLEKTLITTGRLATCTSSCAFFVRLQSSYVAARSAELCWQGSRTFPKHWTNALRKSLWS